MRQLGCLCGLLAVLLAPVALQSAPVSVADANGKPIAIDSSARVVSIGGSITEIVYALGAQDRLVAVDSTSRHPAAASVLPNVGYMRQLSAEPILALSPTLVLAEADAGPPAALDQLREAGVAVLTVVDRHSPAGIYGKIHAVAAALDLRPSGIALVNDVRTRFAAVREAVAEAQVAPKVLFLLSVGNGGAPLAAGRDTSAAAIIAMAGGVNAIDGYAGYKPMTPEATVAAEPDVILLTSRSLKLLGGEDKLWALPALSATPAGASRRVIAMDGLLLLGFGPRTAEAVRRLARALHPDLAL